MCQWRSELAIWRRRSSSPSKTVMEKTNSLEKVLIKVRRVTRTVNRNKTLRVAPWSTRYLKRVLTEQPNPRWWASRLQRTHLRKTHKVLSPRMTFAADNSRLILVETYLDQRLLWKTETLAQVAQPKPEIGTFKEFRKLIQQASRSFHSRSRLHQTAVTS